MLLVLLTLTSRGSTGFQTGIGGPSACNVSAQPLSLKVLPKLLRVVCIVVDQKTPLSLGTQNEFGKKEKV